MISCNLLVFCDSVLYDTHTEKLSLINIHESIVVKDFPVTLPQTSIFISIQRTEQDPESPELKLEYIYNNLLTKVFDLKPQFRGLYKTQSRVILSGLNIGDEGQIVFRLFYGQTLLHAITVPIYEDAE